MSHRGQTESAMSHNTFASVAELVVPWVADHLPGWTIDGHHNMCGQSCMCCRACNWEDRYSGCLICNDVWELSCVSRFILGRVKENGRTQLRRGYEPQSMLPPIRPARWGKRKRNGWYWVNSPQLWTNPPPPRRQYWGNQQRWRPGAWTNRRPRDAGSEVLHAACSNSLSRGAK